MFRILAIAAVASFWTLTSAYATDPDHIVRAADKGLRSIMEDSESAIPQKILSDAHAVLIFPDKSSIKLIAGSRTEQGVLVIRGEDGAWGKPQFVRRRDRSFGLQAGYTNTTVVSVYMTRKRLEYMKNHGDMNIGLAAAASLGRLFHGNSQTSYDLNVNGTIRHYSKGRKIGGGLYASTISMKLDPQIDAAYYGDTAALPESAVTLLSDLTRFSNTTGDESAVQSASGMASVLVGDADR